VERKKIEKKKAISRRSHPGYMLDVFRQQQEREREREKLKRKQLKKKKEEDRATQSTLASSNFR
jgi:hypothetical protein